MFLKCEKDAEKNFLDFCETVPNKFYKHLDIDFLEEFILILMNYVLNRDVDLQQL